MPTSSRKRILIVAVNWLGDLVFMTPAIRAIRRAHPESHIACLVSPRGLDLLEGNPNLNEVIPLEETRGLASFFRWRRIVRRLREGRFDTAYLFHRSLTRALWVWAAGIPRRVGYRTWKRGWLLTGSTDPPAKDSVHKVEWFLRILEADGIRRDGTRAEIGIRKEDEDAVQRLLLELGVGEGQRLVALHAGANWRLKRWPLGNFARLADALRDRCAARVIFIGGEGDRPLVEGILRRMQGPALVAAGRTTLRELGALLARARLLISNDSGPLHLGVAVGIPVIGLFGPTKPTLTGPPPDESHVTLFGSIGCPVPCYRLHCPVNLCMHQIAVEEVLEAAARLLNRGQTP